MPRQKRKLTELARQMRFEPTIAEKLLWQELRRTQIGGLKFRRQQPIGDYIVDFVCPQARVAIELDGDSHENQEFIDAEKESFLTKQGFLVLRFPNSDIYTNLRGVLDVIWRTCEGSMDSRHR